MAVQYESDGGTVFAASASNAAITVPLPATRPTGSVLLLIAWSRLISDTVGTAPSGYTLLTGFPVSSATASGGRMWVYARVATSSETAPTFACGSAVTGNSGDLWGACIFCYSGVDTSGGTLDSILDGTPRVNDSLTNTTTVTMAFVPIGMLSTSMCLSFFVRFRDAVDTFTPATPAGVYTEREDAGSTIRTGAQFYLEDQIGDTQSSITVTSSVVGTSTRFLAVALALKAASVAAFTPKSRLRSSPGVAVVRAAVR